MLQKIFQDDVKPISVRTEVLAGITTFMTMAYILAVNPDILSSAGMDKNAVFTATALSAGVATLVMAFLARLPFALAPGMGLNAFFAFTVVISMGYSWQFALTAVFIEGIIFIFLTLFNIRELIINSIPLGMKHAVSGGIGLFIALIGLQKAGLIVSDESTLVRLGEMGSPEVLLMLGGLVFTAVLMALNVKGALLVGIFAATLAGIPLGVTHIPHGNLVSLPPSLSPIFLQFDFSRLLSVDMLIVIFTFLFMDMFDTVGTLVGVASKAGMLTSDGKIPKAKQALMADAIGTAFGAIVGTSTVTTYVESAAGVAVGGRTGLTAFIVAILFLLALFLAPVFVMIPGAAIAPALVLVGFMMISPIANINFSDFTEAFPAFLTIIVMPLTYSISEGIVFGMLAYVLLKVLSGKLKDISLVMVILALLFVLKFFLK